MYISQMGFILFIHVSLTFENHTNGEKYDDLNRLQ